MPSRHEPPIFSKELINSLPPRPKQKKSKTRIHKLNKKMLIRASSNCCFYCQSQVPPEMMTVDHVVPKSAGGGNGLENLVASCEPCNAMKSDSKSFLLLKWKNNTPKFSQSEIMSLCFNKEKFDLHQSILSYLLMGNSYRAYRVMSEYLNAKKVNSLRNLEFIKKLKEFDFLIDSERNDLLNRMVAIVNSCERNLVKFARKNNDYEFHYLINGEIYSDIPYFNIFAMDEEIEELSEQAG